METIKQQNKSRIELFDNEERVKLIEDVQQRPILRDLTDKKQKSKARYKRRRRAIPPVAYGKQPAAKKTAREVQVQGATCG
ncbi:hypothetical protein ACLKA6_017624 [Drosophila palustris]